MIQIQSMSAVTVSASPGDESQVVGVDVVMRILPPELADLLSEYSATSATTPTAATCRSIARPLAAELAARIADGSLALPA